MRKVLHIVIFCFYITGVFAQQKVSIHMDQQPVTDLFNLIKEQTGCRIFYLPEETDSVIISVHLTDVSPSEALQQALQGTSLLISEYEGVFFILKDKKITTSLPDVFYGKESGKSAQSTEFLFAEEEPKASSEIKVYTIGNRNAPPSSKIILSGNITDIRTGEPLPGISLYVENLTVGTTTDVFGFYSLQLPQGRHELTVRGMGMKETRRQIMLYSAGRLNIELEEQIYSLKEVTILSERVDNIRTTTLGIERLEMKKIKNIPTVFGEADVVKIVLSLPGVKSVGEISSGFNVRGGATDQNLILYNDGTVYNPTHLFGMFSTFNPDVIKDMELYKSSIPVKYGGRISSVLDINTREGNRKEFQGSASLGLLTSRLTVEGPLLSGKGSYILGGRTTYSDWLLKQIPEESGYHNGNAGFYDLNGNVSFSLNEHNDLYLNGYYSHDRFRFTDEERYAYQNANISAKWRHVFNQKLTGTLAVGYDHYSHEIINTEDSIMSYSLDFGINQIFGKTDFSYYINNRHTLSFGLQSILYHLSPGNYLPEGSASMIREDRIQKEKNMESALYIGDQWDISQDFSVSAGIRYSLYHVMASRAYNIYSSEYLPSLSTVTERDSVEKGIIKTYHGPEFRFSMRYALNDRTSVKMGINTMRQYIHKVSNTTIMSPTDIWKLSDVNIRPQTGIQYAAGFFRNFFDNTLEMSLEVYYKTMDNYLDYRKGAEILMNHHLETEVAGTQGKAYGVELMLRKPQGKLNGWLSYVYSRTKLRQHGDQDIPGDFKGWYSADFDKPHEVKFVGNYKITHRYSFSLNCDYSTGRPITLPVAKYEYAGQQYVYYTDRNKYRIPDFFRVDISFNIEPSHHLTLFTHSTFSFGVYNLTGRKNAYSVYYISNQGQIQGYKLSIFGVPIPYVSYNIKF